MKITKKQTSQTSSLRPNHFMFKQVLKDKKKRIIEGQ
jgi:hypothetical protein